MLSILCAVGADVWLGVSRGHPTNIFSDPWEEEDEGPSMSSLSGWGDPELADGSTPDGALLALFESQLPRNSGGWRRPCLRLKSSVGFSVRDADCEWRMAAVCQWAGEGEE